MTEGVFFTFAPPFLRGSGEPSWYNGKLGRMQVKVDDLSNKTAQSWANIVKGAFNPTDRKMAYSDLARYGKEKIELIERIKKLKYELSINPQNGSYPDCFWEK